MEGTAGSPRGLVPQAAGARGPGRGRPAKVRSPETNTQDRGKQGTASEDGRGGGGDGGLREAGQEGRSPDGGSARVCTAAHGPGAQPEISSS